MTQSSTSSTLVPSLDPLRLLSCLEREPHGPKLYQDPIHDVQTDKDLFNFLRQTFIRRRRRLFSSLSLRAPDTIRFIQVKFNFVEFYRYHRVGRAQIGFR
jgi:hypothetical protein